MSDAIGLQSANSSHRHGQIRSHRPQDGSDPCQHRLAGWNQRLRQLVRNAQAERKANKPPRAFRELYREIRALLDVDADTVGGESAGDVETPL